MLSVKHLTDTNELTKDDFYQILDTAKAFEEINSRPIKKVPALKGKTIVNMFLENSTRTRSSFEIAEKRLSADTLNFSSSGSAVKKGESFEDTARTLSAYKIDMVVIRDSHAGAPELLKNYTDAVIMNAGDGKHQHPTQTLLDLYAIRAHFGKLEGLNIAIVGDCSHSRVVGSLVPAFKTLGIKTTLVGPRTFMPKFVDQMDVNYTSNIEEVLPEVDVVYLLRIQLERIDSTPIPSLEEYRDLYGITQERYDMLKENAIVCHPGPVNRGVEIDSELVYAPKSRIIDQVSAGLYVRMASMYLLLGGEVNGIAD